MKLVSINIDDGKKYPSLLKHLKQESPDILLMQEVWDFEGNYGKILNADRDIFNVNRIGKDFFKEYNYVFSPVLDTKIVVDGGIEKIGYYGNAIYSKYPIIQEEVFFFDIDYATDFIFPKPGISFDNQPRNFQKVRINTESGEVDISNVHGIYQLDGYKGDSERMLSMVEKIAGVQNMDIPIILAGDFNLEPNTDSISLLKSFYRELVTDMRMSSTKVGADKIIDYIFISKDIRVKSFNVRNVEISDHYPLVLEFGV